MKCEDMKEITSKNNDEFSVFKDKLNKEQKEHLETCKKCNEMMLRYEKLLYMLKSEKHEVKPGFNQKVLSRLDNAKEKYYIATGNAVWKYATVVLTALLIVTAGLFFYEKNHPTEILVEFSMNMPDAKSISLVGDFNGWDSESVKLTESKGLWTAKLKVKPGRYQYAFVIDGNKWMPDPNSKMYVDSGFGTKNSILDTKKL